MPERWKQGLQELSKDSPTPDLWDRASSWSGPFDPTRRKGGSKLLAGLVAMAVFLAGGYLTWLAFSPGGEPRAASGSGRAAGTPVGSGATTGAQACLPVPSPVRLSNADDIGQLVIDLSQTISEGRLCDLWSRFASPAFQARNSWEAVEGAWVAWLDAVIEHRGPLTPGQEAGELNRLGWVVDTGGIDPEVLKNQGNLQGLDRFGIVFWDVVLLARFDVARVLASPAGTQVNEWGVVKVFLCPDSPADWVPNYYENPWELQDCAQWE